MIISRFWVFVVTQVHIRYLVYTYLIQYLCQPCEENAIIPVSYVLQ